MKKAAVLIMAIAFLFTATSAFAATPSPWTTQTTYQDKVLHKLDFAVKNTLGGWTQIFRAPMKAHTEKTCPIRGTFYGIYTAVADTAGGLLHLVTFPIPQIDIPLPDNGVQF